METKVLEGVKAMTVELKTLVTGIVKGWELKVQGTATILIGNNLVASGPIVSIDTLEGATYINPSFGSVELAVHPSGNYNTWVYEEAKNGVLNVPYTIINGKLFMGIFPEPRYTVTENGVVCRLAGIPGGFGEGDPKSDALRELFEETGITGVHIFQMLDPQNLPLSDVVSNRAFIVDRDGKNGQLYFGLYIPPEKLLEDDKGFYMTIEQLPEVPAKVKDEDPAITKLRNTVNAVKSMSTLSFVPVAMVGLYARDLLVLGGQARLRSLFDLELLPQQQKQQQEVLQDYSYLSNM
jgi:ADP-ribose pyrophosphatase YjhB (NUDIX family)